MLDLFAGSGALGLEALSRGAASCVFVERDREAARVIQANLEKLRLTGAVVANRDVDVGAPRRARARPPLRPRARRPAVRGVGGARGDARRPRFPRVLADDALVVVETSDRVEPELPLDLVTTRRYGSARITVFSR